MKEVEATQARASLGQYARELEGEPILVTDRGKPIAVLIPIENADLETVRLGMHPRFLALIERSRSRYEAKGGISPEDLRRRLGIGPGEHGTPA